MLALVLVPAAATVVTATAAAEDQPRNSKGDGKDYPDKSHHQHRGPPGAKLKDSKMKRMGAVTCREEPLYKGHLSNEDTACSSNHIELCTNLPLN